MKTQRVVVPEPGKVTLEEIELRAPGPGEVLVQTEVTLISPGTERAWFLHEPDTPVRFPYRPGYCHVGRVVSVGEGVDKQKRPVQVGDRVLTRASHTGAALLPTSQVTPVPQGVAPEHAVFGPLGAISLQGVRKARIELGSAVAVMGAGLIGLLALKLARLSGAHPLVVSDLSELRRKLAERCGGQAVAPDALVELSRQVERRRTIDWGFDVVIDATGHPAALGPAIEACGQQGTIVLLGSTRGRADGVNVYEIHRKGLHLVGAHGRNCPPDVSHPNMWTVADDTELFLRLLRDNRLTVDELLTDRVRPEAVPQAFARLEQRDERLLGCLIDWRGQVSGSAG